MWTIWREWNQCTFERRNTLLDVRRFLLFFVWLDGYDERSFFLFSYWIFKSLYFLLFPVISILPVYMKACLLFFSSFQWSFITYHKNLPCSSLSHNYSKFLNKNDKTENHIMPQCSPKGISLPEISSYFLE